ncbi:RICIN domain-containing protein [Pseudoalteromonas sp. KG3]|uniref:RICIN domain-containing protein n=1 Tax=Pseudoalteromonas prydzensis TaxID=182141 RepID=A0ABR9FID9_9GAMM|nr:MULTISPECIES: RICIN domain-containing protein [Pseudoalteromonas]MBE0456582.1 RICIN domain-containing protein [Pseudoalteromonas prydzensis]WKD24443.1 RICIN domain-containing protein [Pseudoalteromonas sp. KG3]
MSKSTLFNYSVRALAITAAIYGQSAFANASGFATSNGGTTGGAGGDIVYATTGTQIHQALCNRASSDTPIIIHVEGTINHGNTSKVSGDSCNTGPDLIELKEISNVSIIGVGSGALFDQLGIHIRSSSNIIIQNVHVRNVKKSGSPISNGGDAIGMESNVSNVWVDHVTLEASGGESSGYDALFDMKSNTKYVTLSYSILRNSGRGGLVGSSDSDENNGPVTFHHNYYENINSRTPLLRHATAHAYNNYYSGLVSSGMNPRIGGKMRAENNYFKDSKDPLGTFYTNDMGYWQVSGNIWDNIDWSQQESKLHPAGPNPTSTTTINIPYSYQLDNAQCIPSIIAATAGANKGLQTSNGQCGTTTPTDPTPTPEPTPEPTPAGENLALNAGVDGSSKASGSSYGNVNDGDTSTYWSPSSTTGSINIKNLNTTINAVRVIETAATKGQITAWSLVNYDTGVTLANGGAVPDVISFSNTNLSKVSFVVHSANGVPQIAEFEVYNGYSDGANGNVTNTLLNGTYRITPKHSGASLDVANCDTADGANIRQWSWLNNNCQKFNITTVDGVWHRISPANAPAKGLEVYTHSTTAGENINLWTYTGSYNQQFRFQSAGSGKWRIINRNSELCLDVDGSKTSDDANILQWTCLAGAENQMFELTRQ